MRRGKWYCKVLKRWVIICVLLQTNSYVQLLNNSLVLRGSVKFLTKVWLTFHILELIAIDIVVFRVVLEDKLRLNLIYDSHETLRSMLPGYRSTLSFLKAPHCVFILISYAREKIVFRFYDKLKSSSKALKVFFMFRPAPFSIIFKKNVSYWQTKSLLVFFWTLKTFCQYLNFPKQR